jgi:hypothetical protein
MDVTDHRYTIAVHIRRAHLACWRENQGYEQFLSNLHFQMVIGSVLITQKHKAQAQTRAPKTQPIFVCLCLCRPFFS